MTSNSRYLVLPFLISAVLFFSPTTAEAESAFDLGLEAYDAGDIPAARDAWQSGAIAGDIEAQTALAGLYAQGLGVPQDFAAAARWYRRAGLEGHRVAQLNLGELYQNGLGVPQDLAEAYLWYSLAADRGSRWAADARHTLRETMTEPTIAAAEERLANWPAE